MRKHVNFLTYDIDGNVKSRCFT